MLLYVKTMYAFQSYFKVLFFIIYYHRWVEQNNLSYAPYTYCDTVYSNSGLNQRQIIQNYKEILQIFNHNFKDFETFDFSTLSLISMINCSNTTSH